MGKVDRNSLNDARLVVEKYIPDKVTRIALIDFISSAMLYANSIRKNNWNLNLSKSGYGVRFNVGQEYSIDICEEHILIQCMRDDIKDIFATPKKGVTFRGHIKKEKIDNENLLLVPDCLAKVPNSVGCIIEQDIIIEYLEKLKQAKKNFDNEKLKQKYGI